MLQHTHLYTHRSHHGKPGAEPVRRHGKLSLGTGAHTPPLLACANCVHRCVGVVRECMINFRSSYYSKSVILYTLHPTIGPNRLAMLRLDADRLRALSEASVEERRLHKEKLKEAKLKARQVPRV
jgi:hypothetical protein